MHETHAKKPPMQSNTRKAIAKGQLRSTCYSCDSETRPFAHENKRVEKLYSDGRKYSHQSNQSHTQRFAGPPGIYATSQRPNGKTYAPSDEPLAVTGDLRRVACDVLILLYAARVRMEHIALRGVAPADVTAVIRRDVETIGRLLDTPQKPRDVRPCREEANRPAAATPTLFAPPSPTSTYRYFRRGIASPPATGTAAPQV